MKKILFVLLFTTLTCGISYCQASHANQMTVSLARSFAKDIFELNGTKYLQPMVETVNATSNSRFFNQAYIPRKVSKPYFRVSVNGMVGFVRDDQKTYKPVAPAEKLDLNKLSQYIELENFTLKSIKDTAGLIHYAFKTLFYDGLEQGKITIPESAPTVLGNGDVAFILEEGVLQELVKTHIAFQFLPKNLQDTLISVISGFPTYFDLPRGANINTLIAGVPQFEVGSLYGTELLIRFIPKVYMGENIGNFAFWGLGLKHSLSQYWEEKNFYKKFPIDLAAQIVYQGTSLDNEVGVTNARLDADAKFWNFNIHASKRFKLINDEFWKGYLDIYTGVSYETVDITAHYKYTLAADTQWRLGLLDADLDPNTGALIRIHEPEPERGYPGDTQPQYATIDLSDSNVKGVIGASFQLGPAAIFLDFNLSKFNIFTTGIEVRF